MFIGEVNNSTPVLPARHRVIPEGPVDPEYSLVDEVKGPRVSSLFIKLIKLIGNWREGAHMARPGIARRLAAPVAAAALLLTGAACNKASTATTKSATPPATVRLGYYPNLTHAAALVGVAKGFFPQ